MWFKKKVSPPLDYPAPEEWKKLNEAFVNKKAAILSIHAEYLADLLRPEVIAAMYQGKDYLEWPIYCGETNRLVYNAPKEACAIIKKELEAKGYKASVGEYKTIFRST